MLIMGCNESAGAASKHFWLQLQRVEGEDGWAEGMGAHSQPGLSLHSPQSSGGMEERELCQGNLLTCTVENLCGNARIIK